MLYEVITLGALRSALRHARKRQLYAGDTEWCVPPEVRGAYQPRDRALSVKEYQALWMALSSRRRDYLDAFVGLGVRDSELYRITAEDVMGGRVHIRGRKGRRDRRNNFV